MNAQAHTYLVIVRQSGIPYRAIIRKSRRSLSAARLTERSYIHGVSAEYGRNCERLSEEHQGSASR